MANNWNDEGCRNLLFAIAQSAYDELVRACKAYLGAEAHGSNKDKAEAKEELKKALEWFEVLGWKDNALKSAMEVAQGKRRRVRGPNAGHKK